MSSTIVWFVSLFLLLIRNIFVLFVYAPTFEKFKLDLSGYHSIVQFILFGFSHPFANLFLSWSSSSVRWGNELERYIACGGCPFYHEYLLFYGQKMNCTVSDSLYGLWRLSFYGKLFQKMHFHILAPLIMPILQSKFRWFS